MLCCVNRQSTIIIYDWIYYVLFMWIVFRWKNKLLKIICIRGVADTIWVFMIPVWQIVYVIIKP